ALGSWAWGSAANVIEVERALWFGSPLASCALEIVATRGCYRRCWRLPRREPHPCNQSVVSPRVVAPAEDDQPQRSAFSGARRQRAVGVDEVDLERHLTER